MSKTILKDITCPDCGKASQTRLWPVIDRRSNPEQRERILEESLFEWDCPSCGKNMQLLYPCLYHDQDNKLLVLMNPSKKDGIVDKDTIPMPEEEGLRRRVVSTPEQLKEKLLIFEAGLDDGGIELAKFAMSQSIENRRELTVAKSFFSKLDEEEGEITFVFCFEFEEPEYQTTKLQAYTMAENIARSVGFESCSDRMLKVDKEEAKEMLEKYKSGM